MRNTVPVVIACALIVLLAASDVLAGSAGGPPANSKSTGPAVSGTILVGYPPLSIFAIKLTKGTLQSGAVVASPLVTHQFGCSTDPAIIATRFLGPSGSAGLLRSYFDSLSVVIEIFRELGITLVPDSFGNLVPEPVITDVHNAVCSPANSTGAASLDVTIQFATPR